MPQHTFRRFDDELNQIRDLILTMGSLIEKAIDRSVSSFLEGEPAEARRVIEEDSTVNAMEVKVDEMLRRILALRQPAGRDLRFLISNMKVVTDLERIGDLAVSIAKCTLEAGQHPTQQTKIARMSGQVQKQVNTALDALSREDNDLAMQVIENDKEIDALYHDIYRETVSGMLDSPQDVSLMITLTNVIKNLERIGDHATNIAEMVIYTVVGHDIRHVDHQSAAALLQKRSD